ncbi:MAG: sigma-70 family RNA polymerase sigma factor [Acidobacteriota bacterium]
MRRQQKTDEDLVVEALAGSAAAFEGLLRRYQRPVLSLVTRMVRDPALAEDLAQDAFIRAFRNLGSFDSSRKFKSWLFKIAHNRTIDHLRRRQPREVPLEQTSASGEEMWEVLEAPEEESPHRRAESRELASEVDRALSQLRPSYREVLLLRFQQGLAYHEIAEVTGLPMSSVKVQLHRGRKQLAKLLEAAGLSAPEAFAPKPSPSKAQ